jgi:RND superfamily putative drug exporter
MRRWTRFVIRHRGLVLGLWIAVLLAGGFASARLSPLLSNSFSVPGTDSENVRHVLESHFGDRSDGAFTIVFKVPDSHDPALLARLQKVVDRAAPAVRTGKPTQLTIAGPRVVYGDIVSTLNLAQAKGYTGDLVKAIGKPAGTEGVYVTGAAAIQHDLDPIFNKDLAKGEAIAIPIAFLVLLAVFGLSLAVTIPFIFAACTIMGALGIMYGIAHLATTPTYTTNLIQLIGLGIAIDYSLLIVYRFREELGNGLAKDEAVVRTMETAGRAVVFSGVAVALGLAMLLAMPLPFMRMMGVAGFLIPIVSIIGAVTLQPVLLSYYGRRGTARKRILPTEPVDPERGLWARLARGIMASPIAVLCIGAAALLAAAVPVLYLELTPGSTFGIPRTPPSVRGFDLLREAVGPGAIAPTQVLVEARSGSVVQPSIQRAIGRLSSELRRDPEVAAVYFQPGGRFVDKTRRYAQVIVAGRHDYGFPAAQDFVKRLRNAIIPAARFPGDAVVLAGGGPPQGVDFLHQAYRYFPPLILGVLCLTYLLLMRAFRSVLLPLKAVLLNLLSVAAAYGMLVIVFKWGVGKDVLGLYQFAQVEGWIPIFLFAMLFGLSMDYEVFLVSRMRETWDEGYDNVTSVAYGLERTGRIITAAAIVMCAAFSGFVAGRIVGLQQFGLGLAVAIVVDATIVRMLLVPSLMAIFGRWNWWLPGSLARIVRVPPSPLEAHTRPALRPAGR